MVQDPYGKSIISHNADKYMVPASILKIATANAVLENLGQDYRIKTEFYLTNDNYIGVKGFGDPTLVSESLKSIAKRIKAYLDKSTDVELYGFVLDTSFFKDELNVDGQSESNNPYDSSVGALVANFNTVYIYKSKQGKISSAESQTPLTPTAIELAKNLPPGKHRINIGKQKTRTLQYFSELLHAFLIDEGVNVPLIFINKAIPSYSEKIVVHHSKPISEIIKNLLLYSNNFTANQLLIILGGHQKGTPADIDKGRDVVVEFLNNKVEIEGFILEEGSGLSRKNQFTAAQMMDVLLYFKPYQHLLRIDKGRFQAKTGTLKGVSTYAGYIVSPSKENYPFVIMLSNTKWGGERYKIANMLYKGVFN